MNSKFKLVVFNSSPGEKIFWHSADNIQEFIKENFDLPYYDVRHQEGISSGNYMSFKVSPAAIPYYYMPRVFRFRETGAPRMLVNLFQHFLNDLCYQQRLPEGLHVIHF